ncbi:MAG: 3'(2'),5'-bisphosphate nucleotidase CysQ [Rikenellaceae bacterium]|nr:3'(2'),5'-bisphosphate nucleotidase CysQ [Rikenellaceae bacterium]MBQ3255417.1 3'(2'),5'-bisphosphate nucleotidase CysQ [Rikenellaceae bacterium]MBR2502430.1 3'(2'),5'-bisphosphate nucleotidase CysQ [Rikenellaceae bacterium]
MTENIQQQLMAKAYNAAVRAGAVILDIYKREDYHISLKNDQSPLTIADRRAHETIKEYLGSTRIPILSEEGREMLYDERKNWELFWLVDPLDGTKEFINGNNEFTVNIALMSDNEAVAAVVYVPYISRMFMAVKGGGAYVKENVTASADSEADYASIGEGLISLPVATKGNEPMQIAISRSHNTPETFAHIDAIRSCVPDLEVVEQGSSYKFCMLAEGTVDYYVRTSNTYEWDTAAGELILAEAGGSTVAIDSGKHLAYNKELLNNPHFVARSKYCRI